MEGHLSEPEPGVPCGMHAWRQEAGVSLPRPPPSSPSPCAVSTLRPCPSAFPVTRGVTPRLCPPPAGDFIHSHALNLTMLVVPKTASIPVLTSPITGLFRLHATQKPPACRSKAAPLPLPTRCHLPPNWAPGAMLASGSSPCTAAHVHSAA